MEFGLTHLVRSETHIPERAIRLLRTWTPVQSTPIYSVTMGKPSVPPSGSNMCLKGSSNVASWRAATKMGLRSEGVWGFVDGTQTSDPTVSSAMPTIFKALESEDLLALNRIKLKIKAERLA